jgi:hypothetical protein
MKATTSIERLVWGGLAGALLWTGGCAGGPLGPSIHYVTAKDIALVSFDDNVAKGASAGAIRGGDCTWSFMGRTFGGAPTLDKALANARQGRGESISDSVNGAMGTPQAGPGFRYLTDVSTDHDGFNAGIIAKRCTIIKGMAYK